MLKLALITLLVASTLALRTHDTHNLQNMHMLDQALCVKNGGVLCGRIQKDCCLLGCQTKFFVHESCQDGKFLNVTADKTGNSSQASTTPAVNATSESKANTTGTAVADTKVPAASNTTSSSSETKPGSSTTASTTTSDKKPSTNSSETAKPTSAPEKAPAAAGTTSPTASGTKKL